MGTGLGCTSTLTSALRFASIPFSRGGVQGKPWYFLHTWCILKAGQALGPGKVCGDAVARVQDVTSSVRSYLQCTYTRYLLQPHDLYST